MSRRLLSRVRGLLGRSRINDEAEEELQYHLEMETAANVARGMTPAEARRVALRDLGGLTQTQEAVRNVRTTLLDSIWQDVRFGCRMLARNRGFTVVAVLTLALGIGGSAAIFSVVDAALLRPLPYPDPDRLVQVQVEYRRGSRLAQFAPSIEDVDLWRAQAPVFSALALWRPVTPLVLDGPEPERVAVMEISEDYLRVFGVTPVVGRGFSDGDMRQGAPPVVLLGYGFWQSRFGGDPTVVGRVVRLDTAAATVVGVLPPGFYRQSKIWRPLAPAPEMSRFRGSGMSAYGRLRPGVDIVGAQHTLTGLTARLESARGTTARAASVRLQSLYEQTTAGYRPTAAILAAAVALLLLIASVNVAGLLRARGAARQHELAVRASLGAGRARLARQLLTESFLVAGAGGLVGLLVARISLQALVANIPMSLPANAPVTLNARVLIFAVLLSIATGVVVGALPALDFSRIRATDALAHRPLQRSPGLTRRGGQMLIATEVALAVVLLAGAGLMIRSFVRLVSVDVGFDPSSFVTMEVTPVSPDALTLQDYYPALLQTLREFSGVEAAGAVDELPLSGDSTATIVVTPDGASPATAHQFLPGFFEALGVPLLQGSFPAEFEGRAPIPPAVINERAAAVLFGNASPIGKVFEVAAPGQSIAFKVTGVVANVRHLGPLVPAASEVFLAFGHWKARPLVVVVRPRRGIAAIAGQLREAVQALGTRAAVTRIRRGSDWYNDRITTPRRRTVLLGLLGGLGLVLALVGVFGATSYAVVRRTREIGIRVALGARPGEAVLAVLRDSTWPVGIGLLAGLGAAAAATRVIRSFLFETAPADTATFAVVAVALGLAALLAALLPARRAARIDPVVALRVE